jgi:hypothetical protein
MERLRASTILRGRPWERPNANGSPLRNQIQRKMNEHGNAQAHEHEHEDEDEGRCLWLTEASRLREASDAAQRGRRRSG